jgi:hypothetical protein
MFWLSPLSKYESQYLSSSGFSVSCSEWVPELKAKNYNLDLGKEAFLLPWAVYIVRLF